MRWMLVVCGLAVLVTACGGEPRREQRPRRYLAPGDDPRVLPPEHAPAPEPDFAWWCSDAQSNGHSGCERSLVQCEQRVANMAAQGFRYGKCFPKSAAACFSGREKLTGRVMEQCYTRLSDCRQARDFMRTDAAEDWDVITDCAAVK